MAAQPIPAVAGPNTGAQAPAVAAPGGAPATITTALAVAETPTTTNVTPEALLTALLQARRNLEQVSKDARQKAYKAHYDSIVALGSIGDEQSYLTKFAALEQADKAFRAQQAAEEEAADRLEVSGVRLIQTHPQAAETVERSLRGQEQQQPQANQERILRVWEKKAHVGNKGRNMGNRSRKGAKKP